MKRISLCVVSFICEPVKMRLPLHLMLLSLPLQLFYRIHLCSRGKRDIVTSCNASHELHEAQHWLTYCPHFRICCHIWFCIGNSDQCRPLSLSLTIYLLSQIDQAFSYHFANLPSLQRYHRSATESGFLTRGLREKKPFSVCGCVCSSRLDFIARNDCLSDLLSQGSRFGWFVWV